MKLPETEIIVSAIVGGGFGAFLAHLFITNLVSRFENAVSETKQLAIQFASFASKFEQVLTQIKEDHYILHEIEKDVLILKSKKKK